MNTSLKRFSFLLAACAGFALGAGACSANNNNDPFPDGSASGAGGNGGANSGGQGGMSTANSGGSAAVDQDGDGFDSDVDCKDDNKDVNPGAEEICDNGIDDNCNGATDMSEPDQDGDGFGPCNGDCNDKDPKINPAAPEVDGDMIDNNCDGVTDGDFDGDGFTVAMGDCDDSDKDVYPGAKENCFDMVDNDCNTFIDGQEPDTDMDGLGPCDGDCNDNDPNVGPHMAEIDGNGIDDNCDNLIDADIDGDGWTVQNGDCNDNDPAINPAALEECDDMVDNDCDMQVDVDCIEKCELAKLQRSSVGCEYFAVDTDNLGSYDAQQFAVVVSNTDTTDTATVKVQTKSGNNWNDIQSAMLAPETLHQFNLPDRHVDHSGLKVGGAYRIISDVPIIAYQFQPITGQSSYTSDASLLLPTSALDKYYYLLSWEPKYGKPQMVIVASQDNTTVTVKPTVNTNPGSGVPGLTANTAYAFPPINTGDFLQIEGQQSLNGSYVSADKPISVFSSHECANIPTNKVACDHLEEQLFGVQTWGKTYVAARMPVRGINAIEATMWQIVASEDSTTVSFIANPAVTGLPTSPQSLNKGDVLQLYVASTNAQHPGDFIVNATKPVLVAEYLTCSSNALGTPSQDAGDPAMAQSVPAEQFLDTYVLLVPNAWNKDYAILTKEVGTTISIDNNMVPQSSFLPIDDGNNPPTHEVARVSVSDGVHKLTGSKPFGVIITGYDSYDSYAYPGGLDQQLINPKN